jgi:hypothetical protein
MNKEIALKWVAALREGKIKQGRGWLEDPCGRRCVFGVLCKIAEEEGVLKRNAHPLQSLPTFGKGLHECTLPEEVTKWADIHNVRAGFMDDPTGRLRTLGELNDTGRYSFKKLAKIIEKNWRDL